MEENGTRKKLNLSGEQSGCRAQRSCAGAQPVKRAENIGMAGVKRMMDGINGPQTLEIMREFAVLVLLTDLDGELNFVFEKRAAGIRQPGDICFPGGKVEPGESLAECALRETEEEIGICPSKIEVLGEFAVQYELTSIAMHSIVGFVRADVLVTDAKLNQSEVAECFTVPVRFFAETEPYLYDYDIIQEVGDFPYEEFGINKDYRWRRGHKTIALYRYGDRVIWGLTAAIVRRFIAELQAPRPE